MADESHILKATDIDGRPSIIVYEAQSGVIFHITPLNLATLRAVQLKAADLKPYPDPEPYRIPDDPSVAFTEGQAARAEDNPDYIAACRVIDSERAQWTDRAVFEFAVRCPKFPTHESMVEAYREPLAALREIAELPEDDYEAVLFHLVLTWNQVGVDKNNTYKPASSDFTRIVQLAIQTVALTPEEVVTGIRFFRPYVPERRP